MHYGPDLAAIHHGDFGHFARAAAPAVVAELRRRGHDGGLVVDLGCGSGIMAGELVAAGYDVLGVDVSPAMVEIARREVPAARFEVGSVDDVELPPCVGVTAVGEVLSYGASPRRLAALFRRAARALPPGGVLVFDVATPGQGSRQAFHDRPGWTLHLDVEEDVDRRTLRRRMTIFREVDGRYRRSDEEHVLRLFTPTEVRALLDGAGFAVRQRRRYGDFDVGRGRAVFYAVRRERRKR